MKVVQGGREYRIRLRGRGRIVRIAFRSTAATPEGTVEKLQKFRCRARIQPRDIQMYHQPRQNKPPDPQIVHLFHRHAHAMYDPAARRFPPQSISGQAVQQADEIRPRDGHLLGDGHPPATGGQTASVLPCSRDVESISSTGT